jgi:DNA-binding protein H-NS
VSEAALDRSGSKKDAECRRRIAEVEAEKATELMRKENAAEGEKRELLETELAKFDGHSGRGRRGRPAGHGGRRASVAPKYRNPENPTETWAGRGLRPRWAVKGGKKLEDFAIAGTVKASGAKATRRPRKKYRVDEPFV